MLKKLALIALLLAAMVGIPRQASAQKKVDAEGREWWQHAVFYEIYPRSFADSNNDGVGDLNGITSKLGYLHDLGVDAIWITPCFPSPQVDFGYDVSDYENIDPMYGTLADFDHLVDAGKNKNIHVILDFVINHTSDQHKWFVASKSSRTSPYRNWYVWRDGSGPNQPPNNWLSTFGGSAWKFDPNTGQYYYHYFYAEQPDLNWNNPAVEKAMFDVTRWWYKRGVAGFRLDAVDTLFEDSDLRDNPVLPGKNKFGDPNMEDKYNKKLPAVHTELRGLREVADEYSAVLIGETWTRNLDELKEYYGEHNNELQLPMNFLFTRVDKLSPPEFRRQIAGADSAGGWPTWVISNHDIVRSYNRYGDGTHNDEIAKLMAALYLTLRGAHPSCTTVKNSEWRTMIRRVPRMCRIQSAGEAGPSRRGATASALPCNGPTRPTPASALTIRGCRFRPATRLTTSPPSPETRIRCWSSTGNSWHCDTPTPYCWKEPMQP